MTPFMPAIPNPIGPKQRRDAKQIAKASGMTYAQVMAVYKDIDNDEIYLNDTYQVNIRRDQPGWVHLSIKRIDKEPIHDWRDLQQIKNELVGPENEAIELYPAESRLIDTANQYHLWALADPTDRFPIGWNTRLVMDHYEGGNSKQRPFKDI